MTVVYVPISLLPDPIICTLGIAGNLPGLVLPTLFPFSMLILSLGACSASIVIALYYRYRLLANKSLKMFKNKLVVLAMFLFHFMNGGILFVLFYFLNFIIQDKYTTRIWYYYIKDEYPYAIKLVDKLYPRCGGEIIEDPKFGIFFGIILLEFIFYFLISIFGPWYIYRQLKKRVKKYTKKMYSLQRQLIVSLVFQVRQIYIKGPVQ